MNHRRTSIPPLHCLFCPFGIIPQPCRDCIVEPDGTMSGIVPGTGRPVGPGASRSEHRSGPCGYSVGSVPWRGGHRKRPGGVGIVRGDVGSVSGKCRERGRSGGERPVPGAASGRAMSGLLGERRVPCRANVGNGVGRRGR
jgi:hypothetical protein